MIDEKRWVKEIMWFLGPEFLYGYLYMRHRLVEIAEELEILYEIKRLKAERADLWELKVQSIYDR